jgi:hypothetical protein
MFGAADICLLCLEESHWYVSSIFPRQFWRLIIVSDKNILLYFSKQLQTEQTMNERRERAFSHCKVYESVCGYSVQLKLKAVSNTFLVRTICDISTITLLI